ncbi:E3 ubiquitin-protein ligase, partial [Tetrabaena socialis]
VLAFRSNITESSYYQVMDADSLPHGVNVRFEDEQEAEGMGVVREWLSQIAADLFSPERGLFLRGAEDRRVVHPAPHSRQQEDRLGYMRFAGRIVGLALRANVPLGMVLSSGLFSYLTGRRATLEDLRQIDPQ